MNKKSCSIIVFVISLVLLLCGCQEQTETKNNNIDENVELDSDVVEFVSANLTPEMDNGKIISVKVQYLFRNIADKDINIIVYAEFYDKVGTLLYESENRTGNYPKGHVDGIPMINPLWNIISYVDVNASKVDHVKIVVREF